MTGTPTATDGSVTTGRTGGDVVVSALADRGVDTIFALPGIQLDGLFDALARSGMRVVHTRHEQGAAYMADGYARASGRPGVCIVVPGPGVLNAGAALSTAYATGSQVLCIAGDLFGGDAVKGRGALHEIPDQSAVLTGTIGWTRRVLDVADIGPCIDAAFSRLHSLPHRPAALEIGPRVLVADAPTPTPAPAPRPVGPALDPAVIDDAAARLADARHPLVIAGGGAMDAGAEVSALAAALGAPIVVTPSGKGAVDAARPDVLPPMAVYRLLDDCDGLVIVGSRFYATPGSPPVRPGTPVVRIDAEPGRLGPLGSPGVDPLNLNADAAEACRALADALTGLRPADDERDRLNAERASELRAAIAGGLASRFPDTWSHCQALRDVMADGDILVDEMTQVGYMARNGFETRTPRTHLSSGYQGTLGFGYPTALGAKVARPDTAVVSISGDGGFLFNAGELATAAHHGIGVVAVVFTDDAFGNVKGIQRRVYGREIASTLTNPDFVALAASFGIRGWRATDADGLRSALTEAIASDAPAMIEVPIGPQPDITSVIYGIDPL